MYNLFSIRSPFIFARILFQYSNDKITLNVFLNIQKFWKAEVPDVTEIVMVMIQHFFLTFWMFFWHNYLLHNSPPNTRPMSQLKKWRLKIKVRWKKKSTYDSRHFLSLGIGHRPSYSGSCVYTFSRLEIGYRYQGIYCFLV